MDKQEPYAIMRIGKIKSFAILDAVEWHNTRKGQARVVEGAPSPEDLCDLTGSYRQRVAQVFDETGAIYEEGKVLAVEVLLTTSPRWWITASDEAKQAWYAENCKFAHDLFGPGLIAISVHLDESTPHLQVVGLPLYYAIKGTPGRKPSTAASIQRRAKEEAEAPKIWRLSHDHVFGGSSKRLAKLQTRYHGYVGHLGLARGRNTVGQNIKHIPLKHYAQLLERMGKDLEKEAEEIYEDRQMLRDYEDKLTAQYADLRASQEAFRIEVQAFEVREKGLAERERAVEAREAQLASREKRISEREEQVRHAMVNAEKREAGLKASEENLTARQARLQQEEARINSLGSKLAHSESDLKERSRRADERDKEHQQIERQLGLVGKLMVGKLPGVWNSTLKRLDLDGNNASESDKEVARAPWPDWLAAAARQAADWQARRNLLAARLKRMLGKIRIRKREASTLVGQAQTQIAMADAHKLTAEAAASSAEAKELHARASLSALEGQIASSTRDLDIISKGLAASKARKEQLDRENADAGEAARAAKNDTYGARQELKGLTEEIAKTRAERQRLRGELDDLITEKAGLTRERAAITIERSAVDKEHASVKAKRERVDRSLRAIDNLVAGKASLQFDDGRVLVVKADGGEPAMDLAELEPWVGKIADSHRDLAIAQDQEKKKRENLESGRRAVVNLHAELRRVRSKLMEEIPARAVELGTEQKREDERVARVVTPAMHPGVVPPGVGVGG